jgi:hypothetical protein
MRDHGECNSSPCARPAPKKATGSGNLFSATFPTPPTAGGQFAARLLEPAAAARWER